MNADAIVDPVFGSGGGPAEARSSPAAFADYGGSGAGSSGILRSPAAVAGYAGSVGGGGPVGAWRPPAVLTDYDDTAAVQNVAELLLGRFGAPDWPAVRERFRNGELSLKDYQEITFRDIRATKAEMQDFVGANAEFRPGFGALAGFCRRRGIPLAIVSQGLDFYIQPLVDAAGESDIPIYAVTARFGADGRIAGYGYDFPYPDAPERGNSKALIVQRYRQQGRYVFYAGDGRSDFEAGAVADAVFAHRQMAEMCAAAGIAYTEFNDFFPVLAAVRDYLAGAGG